MSATTELLIFQAAPAPTGALALGVPASDAEYDAFSETLKAELSTGRTGAETGKSLPQGGEVVPDGSVRAQQSGATAASDRQKTMMPSTDCEPSDAKAAGAVASETGAPTSAGTPDDASDLGSRADAPAQSALSETDQDHSALREIALQHLTDAVTERDVTSIKTVAAVSTNDTPVQWSPLQISERMDAIRNLITGNGEGALPVLAGNGEGALPVLAGNGEGALPVLTGNEEGALPGKLDPELHQKLAHSQHSLAAIEQRLRQLVGAGVLEFTEAAYRDGTRATALTASATPLISDEAMPLAMADSTRSVLNTDNAPNNQNTAGRPVTLAQSQRLDAIWNMMASSGQGGILGTIAADLHHALANSDDSLGSIQVRLQALSSEGVTHFNKANYFADRSLSDRLATAQGELGSGVAQGRANQAVGGSLHMTTPRADALAAARVAAESAGITATSAAAVDQLAGAEVDPRRAAMAFTSPQNKQVAGRADAMSPDATARAANLTADGLQQAHSTPQARAPQVAAREAGSSTTADRNTAATLSPAQMAEQRRAGHSAASGSLNAGLDNNSGVTASEWKVAGAGRPVTATSELAGLTADLDGPDSLQPSNAARARTAAAIDSRPAASSNAIALDPMATAVAQGSMQDARLEGRSAVDLQVSRSVSSELSQAINTASSATASTVGGTPTPSGLPAAASSASPAAIRAGGEHVMQNAPWAPQFTDEVSEQVRVFVNNGLQEARLQLTPADLGRVQITINTEGDNARVVFVAETAVARDLLDQSMPRLREMLQQSGIQLAHGDVSDQTESQRRGERLAEDAQRMAQDDSDAQSDDQALRPQLANLDNEDGFGEAGRVDTYI